MELPILDPVLIQVGPIAIRWYSLAYIFGIIFAWLIIKYLNSKDKLFDVKKISDDFFTYAVLSIVIGGRLGYILFYNPVFYLTHPLSILKVWEGGMSFHGGLIGSIIGVYFLTKKHKINYLSFCDLLSTVAPIGLFFGRIANFINMELYGRITTSKFGVVFPNAGTLPRHPSQLYEAFLEGFVLFLLLFSLARWTKIRKYNGFLSGLFLCGYSISRFVVEFFREPDQQIGYIFNYFTMGQILNIPFLVVGIYLVYRAIKNGMK